MSDISQGEGWWKAFDGKWYPPETHPDYPTAASPAASGPTMPVQAVSSGTDGGDVPTSVAATPEGPGQNRNPWRRFRRWPWWAQGLSWVGLAFIVLLIIGAAAGGGSTNKKTSVATATSTAPVTTAKPTTTKAPATTKAPPTTKAATTEAPTTAPPTTALPTTAPPSTAAETTGVTPSAWAAQYGQNITFVIASANGLVSAIGKNDSTAINTSCSALQMNYKTFMAGGKVPDPPGDAMAKQYNQGVDEIFTAQKSCSGGLLSKPNLAQASQAANTGAMILNQVLDHAQTT